MSTKEILKKLSNSYGVGNDYISITNTIESLVVKKSPTIDKNQNIFYTIKGKGKNCKKVMIDAHMDEIGFVVTYITDEGFLKLAPVGGIDKRLLLSQQVIILSKNPVVGLVNCIAPHLSSKIDGEKEINIDDLYIDIGMTKEEAISSVSIGDFCAFNQTAEDMLNDFVTGKSFDNRACCTVLINLINKIKDGDFINLDLVFCFSVKEEGQGAVGAKCAAYLINPDFAIVLDVSFAKAPNVLDYKCGEINKGPMIGYSPFLDREMSENLVKVCIHNNLLYQKEIMPSSTGTNSDSIMSSRDGIKTALISIPIKNMHSSIEVVSIKDIEDAETLISHYLKEVDKNV
ncbi:MAG: M42 family metallopeptidase [Oscillospiraceae bacterium]